ncbi:chaplin family protein [Streptomyces sp. NRRL F-5123]|uniref:chaplin family protein n=1 Tax=Streptomyces sp. NRRL F-5123 TaxID=1463856 RepID=UPI000D1474A6
MSPRNELGSPPPGHADLHVPERESPGALSGNTVQASALVPLSCAATASTSSRW